MDLAACICATRRGPGAEPHSSSHKAQGAQQPILQERNLSPSRKLSSTAVTDVTAPRTNRDVPEDPSHYPNAKHVFRRYGSPECIAVDSSTRGVAKNRTEI